MKHTPETITQALDKLHARLSQIDTAVVALRDHVQENPDTIAEGIIVVGRFPFPEPIPGPLPLPGSGECLMRQWPDRPTDVTFRMATQVLNESLLHCADVAGEVGALEDPPQA